MFDRNRFKAVLWDLDDTLYSRAEGAKRMFPELFRKHLYPGRRDAFIEEALCCMLSYCPRGSVVHPDAFAALEKQYPFDIPFCHEAFLRDYYADFRKFITPNPEAVAVLKKLRETGIKTGLVTNITPELLESQKKKVAALGIAELFDVIIYSAELGIHKPDPRIFHHAAQCLGAEPGKCLFVGDDPRSDIAGARGVGMEAVWLDNRPVYDGSFADDPRVYRVHSVLDYFSECRKTRQPSK